MFDPTGPGPGAVPPPALAALRARAAPAADPAPPRERVQAYTLADLRLEAIEAVDPARSRDRARADRALAAFDAHRAILDEARASCAADTAENARRLRDATREALQALLAAHVGLRDRTEQG